MQLNFWAASLLTVSVFWPHEAIEGMRVGSPEGLVQAVAGAVGGAVLLPGVAVGPLPRRRASCNCRQGICGQTKI